MWSPKVDSQAVPPGKPIMTMAIPIFKLLIFIKRRSGTSPQEFQEYYESRHSQLGAKIAAEVGACKYIRRYLESLSPTAFDFDVLTEIWFADRANFEKVAGPVSRGVLPPGVAADEERFMDRSKTHFVTVVEFESHIQPTALRDIGSLSD
jgi:EthD domain